MVSSPAKAELRIKNAEKGVIAIYSKWGNRESDLEIRDWQENAYSLKNGRIELDTENKECRYYTWKAVIRRNPADKESPVIHSFCLEYIQNVPPACPVNIEARAENSRIFVQWNNNLEKDILGYIVYWGTSPSVYENKLDTGSRNDARLESLTDKNYYISVKAYDRKEEYQFNKFSERLVTVYTQYNTGAFSREVHVFVK
jgi:hypothetical protein